MNNSQRSEQGKPSRHLLAGQLLLQPLHKPAEPVEEDLVILAGGRQEAEINSRRKGMKLTVSAHAVKVRVKTKAAKKPARSTALVKSKLKKKGKIKKRSKLPARRAPRGKPPVGAAGAAGAAAGKPYANVQMPDRERRLQANRSWVLWWNGRRSSHSRMSYSQSSRNFARGFYRAAGRQTPDLVFLPTELSVSAVIVTQGASTAVSRVLDQLRRLPLHEIIVVMSGPIDGVWQPVRIHPSDPVLLYYAEPLGFEAGRAIGAKAATSDILLFLDDNSIVKAEDMLPFIRSVAEGNDVAMNRNPGGGTFDSRGPAAGVAEFLNLAQGRRDLGAASLSNYPHALSRRAVEQLGHSRLAAGPAAQAVAVISGLQVTAPASVSVHRLRPASRISSEPAAGELLYGDLMEAFWEFGKAGQRAAYPDLQRKRDKIKEVVS